MVRRERFVLRRALELGLSQPHEWIERDRTAEREHGVGAVCGDLGTLARHAHTRGDVERLVAERRGREEWLDGEQRDQLHGHTYPELRALVLIILQHRYTRAAEHTHADAAGTCTTGAQCE